jgi:carbon monoxide dehydrogenase subunit G
VKVELEKVFPLPVCAATAWRLLRDVEAVAACMPGASITERIDERHYKGTVAVKFGPASMAFRGDVVVQAIEPSTMTLVLGGKGTDSTGSSGASMDLNARLEMVDAASCRLLGHSAVSMSGKAATFGGRMMTSVADQVLKQFADNFARRAEALAASPPVPPDTGSATAAAAPVDPTTSPNAPPSTPLPVAPAAAARQLDGLALAWAVLRDWLRSLFAARKT